MHDETFAISLRASQKLQYFYLYSHALFFLIIVYLLFTSLFFVLLFFPFVLSVFFTRRTYNRLAQVEKLSFESEQFYLVLEEQKHAVEMVDNPLVSYWLVVLSFRLKSDTSMFAPKIPLILLSDSAHSEDLRRLRKLIKRLY